MSQVIKHFQTIIQTPHCSKQSDRLRDFLIGFAKNYGYEVQTDTAGNIFASKGTPKLLLQAHYDMVCMGKAPQIETYEEEGWLKAKESSLGADNGVAVAMMMALMEEGRELGFLFTADEEIGLIGANALAFDLRGFEAMLNLDSEDEAEVYIGCAGGADIVAEAVFQTSQSTTQAYSVRIEGLPGGHSGVDIDKNIPNAIGELARFLYRNEIKELAMFQGGSRRNAIPSSATAIVCSHKPLKSEGSIVCKPIEGEFRAYKKSSELITALARFKTGVRELNESLQIPHTSINLAILDFAQEKCRIELSARAMDMSSLEALTQEAQSYFEAYGLQTAIEDKYPAWKPQVNDFTLTVEEALKAVFGHCERKAIHAGLECGVIAQKYPHLKLASIGPTIRYPHSTREMLKLDSVDKTYAVIKRVIDRL